MHHQPSYLNTVLLNGNYEVKIAWVLKYVDPPRPPYNYLYCIVSAYSNIWLGVQDPSKPSYQLCIINLVISNLYR